LPLERANSRPPHRSLAPSESSAPTQCAGVCKRALLGQRITLREARKMRLSLPDGTPVVVAFHPSAVLRAPDAVGRVELDRALVADLRSAAALAGQ
jgi:uracil-DNA glycosylase